MHEFCQLFCFDYNNKIEQTLDESKFGERKKKDINFNEKLYLNIKMCGRKRTDTL